jgi:hypothetical protein
MNILQNTGLVLINKKNNYIFFNNSLTQWHPSTQVMTINLEDVFNEYEQLKMDSFSGKKLDDIKEFCKYAKIIEIQRKIDFNVIIEIGVIMFKDDFKKIYYGVAIT